MASTLTTVHVHLYWIFSNLRPVLVCESCIMLTTWNFTKTRIPSSIWSRLYRSFLSALNTSCLLAAVQDARLNTHGQKFDPESLYEPM